MVSRMSLEGSVVGGSRLMSRAHRRVERWYKRKFSLIDEGDANAYVQDAGYGGDKMQLVGCFNQVCG